MIVALGSTAAAWWGGSAWLLGAAGAAERLRSTRRAATATVAAVVPALPKEDGDMLVLRSPDGLATLWLIGTAHVSNRDAAFVREVVQDTVPESVVVEMDDARLPRLGLSLQDLGTQVVIPPPPEQSAAPDFEPWDPRGWAATAAAPVMRAAVTAMYSALTLRGMQPGGEFKAAIDGGLQCGSRIVLADLESETTIESFLKALLRSNLLDFMQRYTGVVDSEVGSFMQDVGEVTPEVVDKWKAKIIADGRLVKKLRTDVPEFYDTFLGARDAHMARAIQAEAAQGSRSLVAVVGMAHMEGIEEKLAWERVLAADDEAD